MVSYVIWFVDLLSRGFLLLVIAQVFLSYFLAPYHPLRRRLDRLIDPLLTPIRRILPPVGMFDFSALVLIILVQLASRVIIQLLATLQ